MEKFTFRKVKRPGGLSGIGWQPRTTILIAGFMAGELTSSRDGTWTVGIRIEKMEGDVDNNPNCSWRWARFVVMPSEEFARQWMYDNRLALLSHYTLHLTEND